MSVFFEGLCELLSVDPEGRSVEADAAGLVVAETFLLWRKWLESKFKKR